jgi:hypothetical protein
MPIDRMSSVMVLLVSRPLSAAWFCEIALKLLVVAAVYVLAAQYCRRSLAAVTAIAAILWSVSGVGWLMPAACLLNLCAIAALLPTYVSWVSRQKLAAAGFVSGLVFLYCYPVGGALLGVQVLVLGSVALWHVGSPRLPFWMEKALPVVVASLVVGAGCFWFHLLLESRFSNIFDAGHSTFAAASGLEATIAFLVLVTAVLGWFVAFARSAQLAGPAGEEREMRRGRGFLVGFSLLAVAMLGLGQFYLSIVPSVLVLALLLECSAGFRGILRWSVVGLAAANLVAAAGWLLHRAVI